MNGIYVTEDKVKECPVCKQKFTTVLSNWEDWGWRTLGRCFCSYHCMRAYEREYFGETRFPSATRGAKYATREMTASERADIMAMYLGGDTVTKIAKTYHTRSDRIRSIIREESRKMK